MLLLTQLPPSSAQILWTPAPDTGGGPGGGGDFSTNTTTTAAGELVTFADTTGKLGTRSFAAFSGPASTVKTYTLPNANATLTQTIASGTAALGTSAIASGTCATVVTATATGVVTTDVVTAGFQSDPTSVTGYIPSANGMLTILAYPSSGAVHFKCCNNTAASITPGALSLNFRVVR